MRKVWRSYRVEYGRRVVAALAETFPADIVSEADLAHLPSLVADYVRRSGAVGRPRVTNFRARVHGRIRSGRTKPWMSFTGEQVNTFMPRPSRLFFMDATLFGLPVDVLHVFVDHSATMRVKACSILSVANAAGPEMNQGETVTLFNDLCVLAPAALVDAPVVWHEVDERRVRGAYTYGTNTVTAELTFNADHELVDFVSDDRLRASVDGKSFVRQRWSTPVHDYQTVGARRIPKVAEARWHAPEPEGEFVYVDFHIDQVMYNAVGPARTNSSIPPAVTPRRRALGAVRRRRRASTHRNVRSADRSG